MNDSESTESPEPVELGDIVGRRVAEMLAAADEGRDLGLQTGYRELDDVLGSRHERLVILAGRPLMGKSLLAQSIGENAADRGFPAAFISLEMSQPEIQLRALARESQVYPGEISRGRLSSDELALARVTAAVTKLGLRPFYIEEHNSLTLAELADRARELKRQHGIRVLIVDYVQLLLPEGCKAEDRPNELEAITRGLKLLSLELDIHVIALAQINRSVESRADKRPTIADLEEWIEDHADLVLLLHRDDAYGRTARRGAGILEVIVAYNRDGEPRTFKLAHAGRTCSIDDLPPQRKASSAWRKVWRRPWPRRGQSRKRP